MAETIWLSNDRVHVNYKELGYYAPGTITRRNVDGTYAIDYDDGEKEQNVPAKLIFPFGNHPPVGEGSSRGGNNDPFQTQDFPLLVVCFLCLFVCGLLAAIVAFVVFGIMFLVQDQDVCEHYSPLFVFGVVFFVAPCFFNVSAMCIAGFYMLATKTKQQIEYESDRNKAAQSSGDTMVMAGSAFQTPVIFLVIMGVLSIATYGMVTLYGGYTCDDMKAEPLYIWAQVAVWYYLILVILFFLAFFGSMSTYKKWEQEYDQKMRDGGSAASTSTEATPLVGGDLESQKQL